MDIPKSFADIGFRMFSLLYFFIAIPSEEVAINFCVAVGLIPARDAQFRCKKNYCRRLFTCEDRDDRKPGWRYRCPNRECRQQVSPLINTFFEETRLNIRDILIIILSFVSNISVTILSEQYPAIPKKSIIQWYVFCREVCMTIINNDLENQQIGGENLFVEVDEAHLSSRKDHKGRVLKGQQQWVLGMICRETKDCKVVRVPDRTKGSIIPIMQRYIHKDSIIVTDSAKVYQGCEQYGFTAHKSVCHQRYFVCPKDKTVYTNTIENLWSRLKPSIKSHREKGHIDLYIAEWCYREKYFKEFDNNTNEYTRIAPGLRFQHFIRDIVRLYPGPFKVGIENPFKYNNTPPNTPPPSPPSSDNSSDEENPEERHLIIARSKQVLFILLNGMSYTYRDMLKNAVRGQIDVIRDVLTHLRAATPQRYTEDNMRVAHERSEIPDGFLNNYLPVQTTPNGDCLYNAISLCLFGNQQYTPAIRLGTLSMLHKYRDLLVDIGATLDLNIDNCILGSGVEAHSKVLACMSFGKDVIDRFHWANAITHVGTSLAIGRPIYIYYSFKDSNKKWRRNCNRLSGEDLNNTFNYYWNIRVLGCADMVNRRPVRVFLHGNHFSALLPDCTDPLIFEPSQQSDVPPLVVNHFDIPQISDI